MLIAEMLLLAAIIDTGVVPWGDSAFVDVGLSGGLLAKLAIGGHLTVAADGRVHAGDARPDDALLAAIYDALREHLEGKKTRPVVVGLSRRIGGSQARVASRLAEAGALGQAKRFRWQSQYPVLDVAARQAVLEEARMAMAVPGPARPQIAVALALALRCRLLGQVARGRRTRAAGLRRMDQVMADLSFALAVADSVERIISAVAAAARALASS